MSTATSHSSTSFVKDVRRNKETRDWDAYILIGGEEIYLGSRERSWDAEQLCNEYVLNQLQHQPVIVEETEIAAAPERRDDLPIGEVDGLPVQGSYMETGELYCAKVWRDGIKISTDGADYINIAVGADVGCVGDISLEEWRKWRIGMDFERMTDQEIRQYAAGLIAAATGNPARWYVDSAALFAQDGKVGMLRNANYGAVAFDPLADIESAAEARLSRAQACFRWGY